MQSGIIHPPRLLGVRTQSIALLIASAADERNTILASGAAASTAGSRSCVRYTVPKWFVPSWVSQPCSVFPTGTIETPALLMRTSSFFTFARKDSAKALTELRERGEGESAHVPSCRFEPSWVGFDERERDPYLPCGFFRPSRRAPQLCEVDDVAVDFGRGMEGPDLIRGPVG